MYKYIKKEDLERLVQDNREAWIVYGINTKDKEEYMNNITHTLNNCGFNTSLLTQYSIFKLNTSYNIVLTLRKNAKLDNQNSTALNNWIRSIGNVVDIATFMKNTNDIRYRSTITDCINCTVDTGIKKNSFIATIRFTTDKNGDIKDAIVISPKFKDIHGHKIDTVNCERNVPKLVERLYGGLYRRYGYRITRCSYKLEGKLLRYNIVPTSDGIKLSLLV